MRRYNSAARMRNLGSRAGVAGDGTATAPPFDPADLTGLEVLVRVGTDLAAGKFWQDTGKTTLTVNPNDIVKAVTDSVGAIDFTDATGLSWSPYGSGTYALLGTGAADLTGTVAAMNVGTGQFFFYAWVWVDALPVANKAIWCSAHCGLGIDATGHPYAFCHTGGTYPAATSAATMPLKQWVLICGWYDGTNLKLQMNDGSPVTTTTASNCTSTAGSIFSYGGSDVFVGRIPHFGFATAAPSAADLTNLYEYGPSTYTPAASTLPISENFEGVTPPAIPSSMTRFGSSDLVTHSGSGYGGGVSLRLPQVGVAYETSAVRFNQADTIRYTSTSGNMTLTAKVRFDAPANGTTTGANANLYVRLGEAGGSTSSCYLARIAVGYTSFGGAAGYVASIKKQLYGVSGAADISSAVTFTVDRAVYYIVTFVVQGSSLSMSIQRPSDGHYVQTDGSFSATPAYCCTATDTQIPRSGYYGVGGNNDESGAFIYYDDISATAGSANAAPSLPYSTITNGQRRFDASGNILQLQGGCHLHHSGTWYAFGPDYTNATYQLPGLDVPAATPSRGIRRYSTTDFMNYTDLGLCFDAADRSVIVERPSVVYWSSISKFVMAYHSDNIIYSERTITIVTSATVDFASPTIEYVGQVNAEQVGDCKLFLDGTTLWLYYNNGSATKVVQINTDFSFETSVDLGIGNREASVPWKDGSTYYILGSGLTGWTPNEPRLYSASAADSTSWTQQNTLCQTSATEPASVCYRGQPSFRFDTGTDPIIALDRWNQSNLSDSQLMYFEQVPDGGSDPSIAWQSTYTPT